MTGFFKAIVSHYRTIIDSISSYTTSLPPHTRNRLATWLIFEATFRKPGLPPAGRKLSREARYLIEDQVALFAGYMVIFAHDDAVDKYNLQTGQIYDQLSRCMVAFLLGLCTQDGLPTAGALVNESQKWLEILQKELADFPDVAMELPHLLNSPTILNGIPFDEQITIRDLLIKREYEELCRQWLNASIVSAMGMGRAFREVSSLLRQHLGEEESAQHNRYVFFIKILAQCMYAQAHSPEQKSWDMIRYDRFIELAYFKSTILIDLYNYVSDQVNEKRFFATRHNSSRACDQILDDLKDYEEDTHDQVLNILHMHILEQGRLAEKFLLMPNRQIITIALVHELIDNTKILRITYDDAFIYHNPFVQAARDPAGNLLMEMGEAETILREIWVNSQQESDWPIEKLARHRASLASKFKTAWQARNDTAILKIIHQSNFPMALLKSYSQLEYQKKRVIIQSYAQNGAQRTGYVSYYSVTFSLKIYWLSLWLKRMFWFLRHPEFHRLHLKGVSHGN